jgi:Tfp pilus assembly ATPase PilU
VQEGEREGKSLIDAMNDSILDGMQSFDYELERLVTNATLDKDTALSYATNRTNLALRLDTQSGEDAGPTIKAKDAPPARKLAPKSELDDLIER